MAKATCEDKLLKHHGPKILRAQGKDPDYATPKLLDEIKESMPEASWYTNKLGKVATTQWSSYNDAMAKLLAVWHERLIALQHLGITEGWLKIKRGENLMRMLKPLDSADIKVHAGDRKESTRDATLKAARMRQSCQQAVRFSCFAMSDPDFHLDSMQVEFATKHGRKLNGLLQKDLKSIPATKKFHVSMVTRDPEHYYWQTIEDIMSPLRQPEELKKMGLVVSVEGAAFSLFSDSESPKYFEQKKIMDALWRLLLDQWFQFLMGFNHYTAGYPGLFAELLVEDKKQRMEQWQKLVVDYHDFKAIESKKHKPWLQMAKRSWFHWVDVREMFENDPNNQYSDALHKNALRIFAHQGDSVICEKHFQTKSDQTRQSKDK